MSDSSSDSEQNMDANSSDNNPLIVTPNDDQKGSKSKRAAHVASIYKARG